ncbi:mitochondrial dicarboxylate carrier [Strongylocentrotus purpuratus]|uniref:Mitochondrial dicarboxylate carrier n=1 Tax=Strongylocentrotus purpuratus TaxID=7668 RepID=A0A7M7RHI4_STRPU|nr:mitochondrial dicarboxylate carrier-like isoform X1 [Strongylocentrotus purpuratus]XP_798522.3 mitochondrial dicarboxylate carrier [Strongylocentrotus purpuratus]|eukprot:XP_798522.3 PREDICTED: mitochondrial dicarboxylate carrier [Strongylocentrotus purpuratus]
MTGQVIFTPGSGANAAVPLDPASMKVPSSSGGGGGGGGVSPATTEKKEQYTTRRVARFYFGGFAGAGAACVTHPLDLVKVHLQTQQAVQMNASGMAVHIVKNEGVLALYNGLSASLCRQLSYSMARFGIYEAMKQRLTADDPSRPLPFYQKMLLAGFAGAVGGFVGTPADMINVRMQNDIKLQPAERRNYKHALDGLWQVYKKEGVVSLWNGWSMAVARGFLMTFGQVALYDQYKQFLLQSGYFNDNIMTHFTASTMAGTCATVLTQPADVMKTRLMNAKPGEYKNALDCFMSVAKLGPMGFFKGFIPAFVRLGPHTILTFLLFEQFRIRFGRDIQVIVPS